MALAGGRSKDLCDEILKRLVRETVSSHFGIVPLRLLPVSAPETHVVNWVYPAKEHCWLRIEYLDVSPPLIQATLPE